MIINLIINSFKRMKRILFLAFLVMAFWSSNSALCAVTQKARNFAVQSYDFRNFTLEETVSMLKSIGVFELQCYTGQKLGLGISEKFNQDLSASGKAAAKEFFKKNGVKIASYGPVTEEDPQRIEAAYEFCKEFDIPEMVIEPKNKIALKYYDAFAAKFKIKTGIHHHALNFKGSNYYSPKLMLEALANHPNLNAVPDVGHLTRGGFNPSASLKLFKGRIGCVHLKDNDKANTLDSHCVPYGTGVIDFEAIFAELDSQGFEGYYIIEYESDPKDPLPAIAKCVEFVKKHPKNVKTGGKNE